MPSARTLDLTAISELLDAGMLFKTDEYTSITDEAAEILNELSHPLSLNGLQQLDVSCAQLLARPQQGAVDLNLDNLVKLAADSAGALFECTGTLSLRGLTPLTAEVAQALNCHTGILQLSETLVIPTEAARELRHHEGELWLSCQAITEAVVDQLAIHGGELWFYGGSQIPNLPQPLLERFLQYRLTKAHLERRWLCQNEKEIPSQKKPWDPWYWSEGGQALDEPLLTNFKAIDLTAARVIARHPHWNTDGESLHLTGLEWISLAQAKALSKSSQNILLGTPQMSEETNNYIEAAERLQLSK
jgi:hypothetical protein